MLYCGINWWQDRASWPSNGGQVRPNLPELAYLVREGFLHPIEHVDDDIVPNMSNPAVRGFYNGRHPKLLQKVRLPSIEKPTRVATSGGRSDFTKGPAGSRDKTPMHGTRETSTTPGLRGSSAIPGPMTPAALLRPKLQAETGQVSHTTLPNFSMDPRLQDRAQYRVQPTVQKAPSKPELIPRDAQGQKLEHRDPFRKC
ncbi:hypothetical protein BDV95DRAFT_29201 [Massariosphaeria phaeospora]|uniref:Uncharacterized protein n=1 Tax=Massariosphaeria phaeospora TaxID=100035 RepID=A0A7C8IE76_9PLEO|nr:hypothetical protein BDV95DRAFT_29201 [Massariosphaeria phaeospora]